jgi:hypothetical protein
MLLRICLVLAIVAGLGIIGLSQFVLRPQIQEIVDKRDENKKGATWATPSPGETDAIIYVGRES